MGNLKTPAKIQKLRQALYAKAKGGRLYSYRKRKGYIGGKPSKKSVKGIIASISVQTGHDKLWMEAGEVIRSINRQLKGWADYFLYQWVKRKHKGKIKEVKRNPGEFFYNEDGTCQAFRNSANLPVGEGMKLRPKAGCGKSARPVR